MSQYCSIHKIKYEGDRCPECLSRGGSEDLFSEKHHKQGGPDDAGL